MLSVVEAPRFNQAADSIEVMLTTVFVYIESGINFLLPVLFLHSSPTSFNSKQAKALFRYHFEWHQNTFPKVRTSTYVPVLALKKIFFSQKTPASDHVFPVVSPYNLASAAGCRLPCIAVYKAALFVTLSQHK